MPFVAELVFYITYLITQKGYKIKWVITSSDDYHRNQQKSAKAYLSTTMKTNCLTNNKIFDLKNTVRYHNRDKEKNFLKSLVSRAIFINFYKSAQTYLIKNGEKLARIFKLVYFCRTSALMLKQPTEPFTHIIND